MENNIKSSNQSKSWELLRHGDNDPISDAISELSIILGIAIEDSKKIVLDVLDDYHFKSRKMPLFHDRFLFDLVVHLTQTFRIPYMTNRYDWYLNILDICIKNGLGKNALDYGGGGGKESIILARKGLDVTYSDFVSSMTENIKKRFELRNLKIKMIDVRDLDESRFDLINCMDVIEHIYDLEDALSDISCRINNDGLLFITPTFINTWDGDHVEKNCAYQGWFPELAEVAGLTLVAQYNSMTYCFQRKTRVLIDIATEKAEMVNKLYQKSRERSMDNLTQSLIKLSQTTALDYEHLNDIVDNGAIFRLSSQRLGLITRGSSS